MLGDAFIAQDPLPVRNSKFAVVHSLQDPGILLKCSVDINSFDLLVDR